MNPSNHMYLSYRLRQPLTDFFLHIFHTHLIGKIWIFFPAEGTEFTEISADVGIIYMLIINKVRIIAVQSVSDDIRKISKSKNIIAFIETETICEVQSFTWLYLFQDSLKSRLTYIFSMLFPALNPFQGNLMTKKAG